MLPLIQKPDFFIFIPFWKNSGGFLCYLSPDFFNLLVLSSLKSFQLSFNLKHRITLIDDNKSLTKSNKDTFKRLRMT